MKNIIENEHFEDESIAVLIACRLLDWDQDDFDQKIYIAEKVKGNFEIYWKSQPSEVERLCFNAGWHAVDGALISHTVGRPEDTDVIYFVSADKKYVLSTLLDGWKGDIGRPPKFAYRKLDVGEEMDIPVVKLSEQGMSVGTIRSSLSIHARREGKSFKTSYDRVDGVLTIQRTR